MAGSFKAYRGMGSIEAMQQGSKDRYFQDVEDDIRKLVPEGIEARVHLKAIYRSHLPDDGRTQSRNGLSWR